MHSVTYIHQLNRDLHPLIFLDRHLSNEAFEQEQYAIAFTFTAQTNATPFLPKTPLNREKL